jgi:hypothetical protein
MKEPNLPNSVDEKPTHVRLPRDCRYCKAVGDVRYPALGLVLIGYYVDK